MLTAYDDINTQLGGFNYLADDYIAKACLTDNSN